MFGIAALAVALTLFSTGLSTGLVMAGFEISFEISLIPAQLSTLVFGAVAPLLYAR